MTILRTIFLLIVFALPSITSAKTLANKEKMDKVSDYFMSQLHAGEIESAFTIMSAYLGVDMQQFLDRGKKVQLDMQQFQKKVGTPLSFALLDKKSVGDHFYKVTYLMKYETAALVWEINFYQPDQGWKLVDVSFNANINALFQ